MRLPKWHLEQTAKVCSYICVCLCVRPPNSRSKDRLTLNVWNNVSLERSNRKGEIMVNGRDPVLGESPVRA